MISNSKRIAQKDIPEVIEEAIPVFQQEIERIKAKSDPSRDEIKLSLEIVRTLCQLYAAYRAEKEQVREQVKSFTPAKVSELFNISSSQKFKQ